MAAYRADIDGLRAVAIVPVVLYHLGARFAGGGFVGVDVFFVISGFLITSVVLGDLEAGKFTFAHFYERRIRRLFPALFVVLAVSIPVATWLLLGRDLAGFYRSAEAATLFSSNVYFFRTSGYFDSGADVKPLLHSWSLAVEEQYYIAYPVLLLLLTRLGERARRWILSLLAVGSLAACELALRSHASAVFYLPQYRAWELLIGALLALGAFPRARRPWQRDAAGIAGLGLVLYAVVVFSDATRFPGLSALAPCAGTALMIGAGSDGGSRVSRLLGLWPLPAIGLASYSLYLWHWPLIVFTKYVLVRPPSFAERALLVVVSFALAAASLRFVERPFRGGRLLSRHALFASAACAMAGIVGVSLLGASTEGFGRHLGPVLGGLTPNWVAPAWRGCFDTPPAKVSDGDLCRIGGAGEPTFLVWGDSHALAYAPAFDELARRLGTVGLLSAHKSCVPALGVEPLGEEPGCVAANAAVRPLLLRMRGLRTVFLVGRWAATVTGTRYGTETGPPIVLSSAGIAGNAKAFEEGMDRTLSMLEAADRHVVLVGQIPEVAWDVPSVLARAQRFGTSNPSGPTVDEHRSRQAETSRILAALARRHAFRSLDPGRLFCPGARCLVEKDGEVLYVDGNHPSVAGGRLALQDVTAEVFAPPSSRAEVVVH